MSDETKTSSDQLASVHDVKHEVRAESSLLKRAFTIRAAWLVALGTITGPVVGTACVLAWGADAVDTRVKAKTDPVVKALETRDASLDHRVEVLEQEVKLQYRWAVEKEARDAERFDAMRVMVLTRQPDPRAAELAKPALIPHTDAGTP